MTDQELKDLVASLAINHHKTAEEAALARTETELARKETERVRTETELIRKESVVFRKELDKAFMETDRAIKATSKAVAETDRALKEATLSMDKTIKELSRQIGGIANKFGSFTEGLALPSMTKILDERFGMTTINPSVRVRDKSGNEHEIDVLAYANGEINTAIIVEVKSHLREEGIEQLLRQCRHFAAWFPELADKKLYGILAAVDASQQLQQKVLDQGLYFAKIHDEQFALCVPEGFEPYCFNPR